MTGNEATAAVIKALNAAEIPYMLVGSLSSNFYGIPRSTYDADFVIQWQQHSLNELKHALPAGMCFEPQLTFEMVTSTVRNQIFVDGSEFLIELFRLSDDPHDQERFQRRRQAIVLTIPTWLPSVEDVIVTKLRWSRLGSRQKDIEDVRNVIAIQKDVVDWRYCEKWCQLHETDDLLTSIRNSLPD